MPLSLLIDIILLLIIIYVFKVLIFNKPKLCKARINKNINYGTGLTIDEKNLNANKVNLIYYIPQYEIALYYINVPRRKIESYSNKLIASAEEYMDEMEIICNKNAYINVKNKVKEEIRKEGL